MTTKKVRSQKQQEERAFSRFYSRFKLWISFKDGNNRDFFEYEADASILQMKFGKVKTVTLDCRIGYNGLKQLLQRYQGKYTTAIIYDQYRRTSLRDGSKTRGMPVEKYNERGELVEWEEIDFSEPYRHCHVITDGAGNFELKTIKPQQ